MQIKNSFFLLLLGNTCLYLDAVFAFFFGSDDELFASVVIEYPCCCDFI